ncbi:carboxypeptidase-like regulatory domain-containing protein [Flavivirga aquimarina]|uniref:Carboxypeptidase-like regulatory domain-containing protein n=1 Tax=Flavivirga aquimarina TaxID=2027862 RepID=A0ABT8W6R0_9FLAO|nr:carboxypeptidase-like regulatory domain-containing protein [Flavivirga aquimarina]MDO5968795.1 carboxypeptidase-like regulatory domain-containing protein [Flavivirga aquimarina]
MKKIILLTIFLLIGFYVNSQNITARLVDNKDKTPIPYATIKTGKYSGVISNEEGYFSLNLEDIQNKTVTISCMGYQNKELNTDAIKALKFIIPLEAAINQLNEVYVSNRRPNVDSIITRVNAKLDKNYNINLHKYDVFYRSTDYADFKSLDFDIEKASHVSSKNMAKANKSMDSLSNHIISSNIIHFSDFKGTLMSLDGDSSKLVVNKATKLFDHKNDFSIDAVQEKAQALTLKYIDTMKTYKVKTGLFKVTDSLSIRNQDFKEKMKNEYDVSFLNNTTGSLLRNAMFTSNSFLRNVLNSKLYDYTYIDAAFNNGNLTYIIGYKPRKSKAKYTGTLYISDEDYAVTKVDYKYYGSRYGKKVNLKLVLGVKFIENVSEGMCIYEKNSEDTYQPKYIKRTKGVYFYVNRGLKFIENSPQKNKIGMDFNIEGNTRNKEELLFTDSSDITLETFAAIKQEKMVPFTLLNTFEKSTWQNEETLEPLQEMKHFGSSD